MKSGKRKKSRRMRKTAVFLAILILTAGILAALPELYKWNLLRLPAKTLQDFGIERIPSPMDFNANGNDDYMDFLLGARKDAQNHPSYDPAYVEGGYPQQDKGVCTDVIWRAFREAGYDLKAMVDTDIQNHPENYPGISKPDPNIDFRRVSNLHAFFKTYGIELTADPGDFAAWQPGDIVIFKNDGHIGIVSDQRSWNGFPNIIHNGGQPVREEDYFKRELPQAHYRFDASLLDASVLRRWQPEM